MALFKGKQPTPRPGLKLETVIGSDGKPVNRWVKIDNKYVTKRPLPVGNLKPYAGASSSAKRLGELHYNDATAKLIERREARERYFGDDPQEKKRLQDEFDIALRELDVTDKGFVMLDNELTGYEGALKDSDFLGYDPDTIINMVTLLRERYETAYRIREQD